MQLHIDDFNPRKMVDETVGILYDEFEKLRDEFPEIRKAKYPFLVVSHLKWINITWDIMNNDPATHKTEKFIEDIRLELDTDGVMSTSLFGVFENGFVNQIPHMFLEDLISLLFINMGRHDKLITFLKIGLRHEVGHLLTHMNISSKHSNDVKAIVNELKTLAELTKQDISLLREDYRDRYNESVDETWFKRYYSAPLEKMANEAVGLTYKDHYESACEALNGTEGK